LKHADLAIYDLDSARISLILKLSMMLKQNVCFMFKHTNIETTTSYNKKEVTVVNLNDEVHENLIDWIKKAKHRVIIWRWKIGLLFTLAITLLVYALVDCRKQNAQDRCCQTQEDFGPRGQETQYCCFWPPTLYLKVLGRDKTHNDRRYRPEDWGRGPYYRPGP
jgi:hypothetical protein